MKKLIKAEWFKLSKSVGYKILLLCNVLSILTSILLRVAGAMSPGYEMLVISLTSILHHSVIGYLFAAVFICSEFSNRTFGMSLLCGSSRKKVVLSKIITYLTGMTILFLVYVCATTLVMTLANGFGIGAKYIKEVVLLLLCGILGNMAISSVIILVTTIAKKTITTIGIGIGLTYASLWIETTFRAKPLPFIKFIYTYQIGQLQAWGDTFSIGMFLVILMVTIIAALFLSVVAFDKMELK